METIVKNILTDDECDLLVSYNKQFYTAKVYNPNTKKMETHSNIRNVVESYIKLPKWFHIKIKNWLNIHGYELTTLVTQYTFLKYTKGSYFKPHVDSAPEGSANKKISLIIELSKSSDYDGGEFLIEGNLIVKDKGDGILFDSHKIHELKEVIDGTRISFVCWILDTQLSTFKKQIL